MNLTDLIIVLLILLLCEIAFVLGYLIERRKNRR